MTGKQFKKWQKSLGFNNREIAEIFDVTTRTINNLRGAKVIPTIYVLAMKTVERKMVRP